MGTLIFSWLAEILLLLANIPADGYLTEGDSWPPNRDRHRGDGLDVVTRVIRFQGLEGRVPMVKMFR